MTLTDLAAKHNIDPESAKAFLRELLDVQEIVAYVDSTHKALLKAGNTATVLGFRIDKYDTPLIARPELD